MTTILIVEDDAATGTMLELLLEMQGYQTVYVGTAEAAIDRLTTHPVDLILSDWQLPGMTGGDL